MFMVVWFIVRYCRVLVLKLLYGEDLLKYWFGGYSMLVKVEEILLD